VAFTTEQLSILRKLTEQANQVATDWVTPSALGHWEDLASPALPPSTGKISSEELPIHNPILQSKLNDYLDRLPASTLDVSQMAICRTYVENGGKDFTIHEWTVAEWFLNRVKQPEVQTSLGLSGAELKEIDTALKQFPLPSLDMNETALQFKDSVQEIAGYSDTELKFRQRAYMVNPNQQGVDAFVDDLYAKGILYRGMSEEKIGDTLSKYINANLSMYRWAQSRHFTTHYYASIDNM